jgi:tryptophan-rich hypothetical protein
VNKINPKKLHNSKWTAVTPLNREKHFMVTQIQFDEEGEVIGCLIEAVLTQRSEPIAWPELTDSQRWIQGWK